MRQDLGGWFWLLPIGMVLSFGIGFFVANSVAPTYVTSREMLFLAPSTVPSEADPDETEDVNPFLSFTSSLNTAAAVVALAATDEKTAETFAPEGSGIDYSVEQPGLETAPTLGIEVRAPTPADADSVAAELIEWLQQTLIDQQAAAGAPSSTWIQTSIIASSANPEPDWTEPVQSALLVVIASVGFTLALLALIVRFKSIRRNRVWGTEKGSGGTDPQVDETSTDAPPSTTAAHVDS